MIRQSQGWNSRLEFSSAGQDGHGSRVKAFEAPRHKKKGVFAASISSGSHFKVHRNREFLVAFSKVHPRTAGAAPPPELGVPRELPCAAPSNTQGASALPSPTSVTPESHRQIWGPGRAHTPLASHLSIHSTALKAHQFALPRPGFANLQWKMRAELLPFLHLFDIF